MPARKGWLTVSSNRTVDPYLWQLCACLSPALAFVFIVKLERCCKAGGIQVWIKSKSERHGELKGLPGGK